MAMMATNTHAHLHLAFSCRKSDKRKLEPDDDEEKPPIKKDADSDDGASDQEGHNKDDTGEMGLVREIRYKLEMLNFKNSVGEQYFNLIFQETENGNNQSLFSTNHFSQEQLCPERAQPQRPKSDLGVRSCALAKEKQLLSSKSLSSLFDYMRD